MCAASELDPLKGRGVWDPLVLGSWTEPTGEGGVSRSC